MEETVTISAKRFQELCEKAGRLAAFEGFVVTRKYSSLEDCVAILGIEKPEEGTEND